MNTSPLKSESIQDAAPALALGANLSIRHQVYDLQEAIVQARALQAFAHSPTRYPVHRLVRAAAHRKLEDLLDDVALNLGLAAHRLDATSLILDGSGAFMHVDGSRKGGYCSCVFNVWTDSRVRAEELRQKIMRVVGDDRVREQMFLIDWQFMGSRGLQGVKFEEIAADQLLDEAYPTLGRPVREFIDSYLDSDSAVLILQGPPGTGKTRLVRAILAAISARKGESAEILYTADKKALAQDEIFVDFITGSHDAFVIEDADHLLGARTDGNVDMHHLLSIADGVIRAQGRKILFTTNLPNVRDIDDALLRPGRCFGLVRIGLLSEAEARVLLGKLWDDADGRERVIQKLFPSGSRGTTLAQVYAACAASRTS